jgi:hypothetical protein
LNEVVISTEQKGQAMGKSSTAFVGMDVHKESIEIAIAEEKDARHVGLPPLFRTLSIGARMISEVSDGAKEIHDGV